LQDLPVTLAIDRAGVVGEDGPTHQGVFDLSFLRSMPNLTVMAPKDLAELAAMLRTAVELGHPAALRYPRAAGENPPDALPEALPIGRAELLREGCDVALFAVGSTVAPAQEAAASLAAEGIEAAVVNVRFVKPLDRDLLLDLARRVGKIVTIEENVLAGGFGSGVLELLAEAGLGATPVRRLGIPDEFITHGARSLLLTHYGLDAAGIASATRAFVRA
jgi:1-deoxy-D-xylulose-5-phosphate synthase